MIRVEQIPPDVLRKMHAIGVVIDANVSAIEEVYFEGRLLPEESFSEEVDAIYRRLYLGETGDC